MEFRKKSYFIHSPKFQINLNNLALDEAQTVLTFLPPQALPEVFICNSLEKIWQPYPNQTELKANFEPAKDLKTPPIPQPAAAGPQAPAGPPQQQGAPPPQQQQPRPMPPQQGAPPPQQQQPRPTPPQQGAPPPQQQQPRPMPPQQGAPPPQQQQPRPMPPQQGAPPPQQQPATAEVTQNQITKNNTITRTQFLPENGQAASPQVTPQLAPEPTPAGKKVEPVSPQQVQIDPSTPAIYHYEKMEYKAKIQTWKYPYFSLSNRVQGPSTTVLEFDCTSFGVIMKFTAQFDFDAADYVDPIGQPGVVKTARFKIKDFMAKKA